VFCPPPTPRYGGGADGILGGGDRRTAHIGGSRTLDFMVNMESQMRFRRLFCVPELILAAESQNRGSQNCKLHTKHTHIARARSSERDNKHIPKHISIKLIILL
jgi:hypothetical protein